MIADEVQTFTFYDLETFGTDSQRDRIVQFAAIRTDSEFNPTERTIIYCCPPKDYLPSVEAIMVTGITPAYAAANGFKENVFIEKVLEFLTRPNNCVLGYNSIKFDDEFIRHTAYRNFFPAYKFNTSNSSSRWDILPLTRLCAALCPEGINFPIVEDENRYDLRLEALTVANNLPHQHAHDALSDVEATIALARLIKNKQPQMFNYVFNHKTKNSLYQILNDPHTGQLMQRPMVTINTHFGPEHLFTGVVLPICYDEHMSNIYCWDITQPIDNFSDLPSPEELDCDATKLSDLGIIKIKLTACPIIVPYNVLTKNSRAERVMINMQQVEETLTYLRNNNLLQEFLSSYIAKYTEYYSSKNSSKRDPDLCLYSLTYNSRRDSYQDSNTSERMHAEEKNNPQIINDISFLNQDLENLLFLYKARNFEFLLNPEEQMKWNQRISKYGAEHGSDFMQELSDNCAIYEKNQDKLNLLRETAQYYGIKE